MSNEIAGRSARAADEEPSYWVRPLEFQHGKYPNLSRERYEKGTNNLSKERCRCMSTVLRILKKPTSFFYHDPWDYIFGGGVYVCVFSGVRIGEDIPPRRGLRYQRQKAVGRMERVDAAGGFFRGWWGLAFVPAPPPGSPEKITAQGRFVTAPGSPL